MSTTEYQSPDSGLLLCHQEQQSIICKVVLKPCDILNRPFCLRIQSCVCYWPNGGNVQYGNILVTCVSTKDEHTYVHRQFNVTHQSQKTVVSVDHFQLQKWPQKNISVWRDFIRSLPVEADAGSTIVHCVDGCGHSGVLVTVLKELQRLRQKQIVNVFETVQELRDNNPHAMRALEHYTLCYEILQELTYQTQQ
ncbi:Receptor-type tyrosine-protein phosphatase alpha [Holothuria leucospilota]|uniref:Receptor-type tyrosine-protein phosphatase alpha n=1 Tax=Holothuria leucospilota TaxID=206669 RepID=A0A9Q1C8M0_HOLLE|nr:Receptor-type tyrosine-protein phosphatase alpha [Holothuria leucospilota]